ncbi:MAG: PKD domain-containing protein [Candidatus Dojkabacteria bacterium]|nr:MAG: PKD domain-containing protein [Candidatus Dojkabacteria bacterium]
MEKLIMVNKLLKNRKIQLLIAVLLVVTLGGVLLTQSRINSNFIRSTLGLNNPSEEGESNSDDTQSGVVQPDAEPVPSGVPNSDSGNSSGRGESGPEGAPVDIPNDVPQANNTFAVTSMNEAVSITLSYVDYKEGSSGANRIFNITGNPSNGSLSGTGSTRTYTPSSNFSGTDTVTWTVSDGTYTSTPGTVKIVVQDETYTDGWYTVGANSQRTSWVGESVTNSTGMLWYTPVQAYITQHTQIIASDGKLFISTAKGLYALDATTGLVAWKFNTEMPIGNSPTVFDDVVYVGGYDKKLYALDVSTGTQLSSGSWPFADATAGYSANPLVIRDSHTNNQTVIIAPNRDGYVYFIGGKNHPNEGDSFRTINIGAPMSFSPAYKDGIVYFAAQDNYAYAYNVSTGAQIWKSPKLRGDGFQSYFPVIYDDMLFLSRAHDEVYEDTGNRVSCTWNVNEDNPGTVAPGKMLGTITTPSNWSNGNPITSFGNTLLECLEDNINNANPSAGGHQHKSHIRGYIVLDMDNGTEVRMWDHDSDGFLEYFPAIMDGTGSGNRQPGLVDPGGNLFYSTQSALCCSDAKGMIYGWDKDYPYNFSMTAGYPSNFAFRGNTSVDPNGDTMTYSWNFDDGTTSTSQNPSKGYKPVKHTYNVTLTVTDSQGNSSTDTQMLKVPYDPSENQYPIARFTANSYSGSAPLNVSFNGSTSWDPLNTNALTYAWDFNGDAITDSTASAPSYNFSSNGTYNVTLTVTDPEGLTDTATGRIVVGSSPGNQPPWARINMLFTGITWQGAGWHAMAEPQALSGGGNVIYRNLCCDRIGDWSSIYNSSNLPRQSGTLWDYNNSLNLQTDDGYLAYWQRYPFTSGLYNWYQGYEDEYVDNSYDEYTYVATNGIYNNHGDQNPIIPYNGRLYVHRGNTIIAFGPGGGSATENPHVTAVDVETTTAVNTSALQIKLETEVAKILNVYDSLGKVGNARFLRPGDYTMSQWSYESIVGEYFQNPADNIVTLIRAYPHVSEPLQLRLSNYLQDYYTAYFATNTYTDVGWIEGSEREAFALADDFQASINANAASLRSAITTQRTTFPQRNIYAMYKYAKWLDDTEVGDSQDILDVYNDARARIRYPFSYMNSLGCVNGATGISYNVSIPIWHYYGEHPYELNQDLAGYYGFRELQILAGQTNDSQYPAANIQSQLDALIQHKKDTFTRGSWWIDNSYVPGAMPCLPTETRNYQKKEFDVSRNFVWMVPEMATYLKGNIEMKEAIHEYDIVGAYWFASKYEGMVGEGVRSALFNYEGMFKAKAYIEGSTASDLYEYLDTPAFAVGDMFYIDNIITVLETNNTIPGSNSAPQVDAGGTFSAAINREYKLEGYATDDGLPNYPGTATFTWSKQSGPGTVTFSNINDADSKVTFDQQGTYVLRLTVSDSAVTAYDDVTVNVDNIPPVASFTATPTGGFIPLLIQFDASGSVDSDGSVVSYAWEFGDGGVGSGVTTSRTYNHIDDFTVRLTITDDDGATHTTTSIVSPTDVGYPTSVFTVSPTTSGTAPFSINVDGTGSYDTGGSIASYQWRWGDGESAGSGSTSSHTYTIPGTYLLELVVTDNQGIQDSSSTVITVTQGGGGGNQSPNASFTANPQSGTAPLTVTVNGGGSTDGDGTISSYSWNWGDGTSNGTGASTTHQYTNAGTYTITLTVTDNGGATDTAAISITVNNAGNQLPNASFTTNPQSGTAPLEVLVNGSGSTDSDGTIVSYSWNWGDGTSNGSGVNASHEYADPGSYTITLTVTDNGGATDTATTNVTATSTTGENMHPTAQAYFANYSTTNNRTVFTGTRSFDPDGTIVTKEWDFNNDGTFDATGNSVNFTTTVDGTYVVTLKVTDDDGGEDIDTLTFIRNSVGGHLYYPIANYDISSAANSTLDYGQLVNGSVTMNFMHHPYSGDMLQTTSPWVPSSARITLYEWDFNGDGVYDVSTSSTATRTYTYTGVGVYNVKLRVTAIDGEQDVTDGTVYIVGDNNPPVASFIASPTSGSSPLTVSVNGTGSADSDGSISSYSWNWGDGTPNGSGSTTTHQYTNPGTYTITLTVTDNAGGIGTDSEGIIVSDSNISPTSSFRVNQRAGLVPFIVTFNGSSSSDSDGTIVNYSWNWGDGTSNGSGAQATHTFTTVGSFSVVLTVTDNNGATSTSRFNISTCAVVNASQARFRWWELRDSFEYSGPIMNCGPVQASGDIRSQGAVNPVLKYAEDNGMKVVITENGSIGLPSELTLGKATQEHELIRDVIARNNSGIDPAGGVVSGVDYGSLNSHDLAVGLPLDYSNFYPVLLNSTNSAFFLNAVGKQ